MKLALILIYISSWKCISAFLQACGTEISQVVSLYKSKVCLPCPVSVESAVSWINPHGELVVSENSVSQKFKKWVDIYENKQSGDHYLMLKYTLFPDHVGVWLCVAGSPVLKTFPTNLTLLVPPAEMHPTITTEELFETIEKEVFIITCTGHYAFPPVTLHWNKKSGPEVEYEINLPRYINSRTGLVSVSLELILSEKHAGSIFECISQHETKTFVYTSLFHFNISVKHASVLHHETLRQSQMVVLGSADKACLLVFVMFILFCFLGSFLLHKLKYMWRWRKVVDVADVSNECLKSENQDIPSDYFPNSKVNQNHNILRCKISFCCQLMILLCLLMMLPVYYKSLEIPSSPDTDHVVAVFMGSALWLDCRNLFQINDLLRIRWSHNGEIFYNQHFTNSKYIGFPQNSSIGFKKRVRLFSLNIGQIVIWPIIYGEDEGIYSAEVLLITQQIKRMSTKVYVLTSHSANNVLVGLISLSILFSFFILPLLFLNCIKLLSRDDKVRISNF